MKIKEILKNRKIMIALASAVLLIVIIILVSRIKKKAEEADGGIAGGGSGNSSLPMASFPLTSYFIAKEYSATAGSYGQQIANLQRICNVRFGYKLQEDGKWGEKTSEAFHKCLGTLIFSDRISEQQYNIFISQYGEGNNKLI